MKKYLKKLLCSIFAISILLVSTIHVDAATPYKAISKKTKVGNYYIWPNSEKGIYVSKSNKLSPKKIVSKPKSSDTYITETLVTNGSKIYYGIVKGEFSTDTSSYIKIYRIDVSGKNKVYVGKVNNAQNLSGYYNGNLFVEKVKPGIAQYSIIDTYIYNLKTKKLSLVKKDFKIYCQNDKYVLGGIYMGDDGGKSSLIYVYNASTKKVYKITSEGSNAKFLNGKIYYAYYGKVSNAEIKTCSYTGKNQKTLCTINVENGGIVDIKSTYVEYFEYDGNTSKETYYRCYYSSGKVVKVKEIILN